MGEKSVLSFGGFLSRFCTTFDVFWFKRWKLVKMKVQTIPHPPVYMLEPFWPSDMELYIEQVLFLTIFLEKNRTCSIYSSMTVGRKGTNIYTGGCAIVWAFISTIFHLLNRNTSKVVQNRDRDPPKKARFSLYTVQFMSCEFSLSGHTLWLARHGKDAKNAPFCSKQRPWHELAQKYNNNRGWLHCGTLHWKEGNISTFALNSSLV